RGCRRGLRVRWRRPCPWLSWRCSPSEALHYRSGATHTTRRSHARSATPREGAMTDTELLGLGGRAALVTGAGMGIGKACALMLARAGARLVVADRDLTAGGRDRRARRNRPRAGYRRTRARRG